MSKSKSEYRYKPNAHQLAGLSAQQVGEELERIQSKNGALTTIAVVEESKPKKAVLHHQFEWDDKLAAEEHRKNQARRIIRIVTVVPGVPKDCENPGVHTQAFVNVHPEDENGGLKDQSERYYKPIVTVLDNPEERQKLIQRCLDKLVRVRNEFAALQEYSAIWASVDLLVVELTRP